MARSAPTDEAAFLYIGQHLNDIPQNVTQVQVDPSIRVVGKYAFMRCTQLRSVKLCEGLESIGDGAFAHCTSLKVIAIPSTVKVIGARAFRNCRMLGSVELREGLESIRDGAFAHCTSLEQVTIPSTVNFIHGDAFHNSRGLVIKFSSGMEKFLKEVSLREWLIAGEMWNLSKKYTELVQLSIPMRFDKMTLTNGKKNIRDMLSRIPPYSSREWSFHFDPIESKLVHYLELQERVKELLDKLFVSFITPHVLSYL